MNLNIYYIATFLFLSFVTISSAQTKIDSIVTTQEIRTDSYMPKVQSGTLISLNMTYGSTQIKNAVDLKKLKGAAIVAIDLLYSDHPKSENFSSLIRKRLLSLQKLSPELFNNNQITWRLIRQTNCTNKETAQQLFHGFIITYRPVQKEGIIEDEIDYLEQILSYDQDDNTKEEALFTPRYDTMVGSDGELLFRLGTGKKDSIKYDKDYSSRNTTSKKVDKTARIESKDKKRSDKLTSSYKPKPDSTILKILHRNDWDNMLIVTDVTGSMSPYTAQLLMWFRFNTISNKVKHFIFFNDGNKKYDFEKEIGKTGGIYWIPSSEYEAVKALVYECMRNGNGRDRPENDLEALIKASEFCPDCENIVLIADNWSEIRDFKLLKKIKKPVKIILCGTDIHLNTQYLLLAKSTGGSIHTIEEDLLNLVDVKEGQIIELGKKKYIFKRGKFTKY